MADLEIWRSVSAPGWTFGGLYERIYNILRKRGIRLARPIYVALCNQLAPILVIWIIREVGTGIIEGEGIEKPGKGRSA